VKPQPTRGGLLRIIRGQVLEFHVTKDRAAGGNQFRLTPAKSGRYNSQFAILVWEKEPG
jgi:hypothetical protein